MQLELQHVPRANYPGQSGDLPSQASDEGHVPWAGRIVTAVMVLGPFVLLSLVVASTLGGAAFTWRNMAVAAVLSLIVGPGVTIGFHRLFTHRAFVAARPLKIALAIAGSMSFQGSLIDWVAN